MKVKVISLPYIFQVLYALCFTMPRYQVSVYRTNGPLVLLWHSLSLSYNYFAAGKNNSILHRRVIVMSVSTF